MLTSKSLRELKKWVLRSFTDKKDEKKLVFLAVVLMFFVGMEMGGFQLILSDVSAEFNTTKTGMGLLVAAQYVSVIAMPLIFGTISDRMGKKPVLTSFVGVFALGCLIAALSNSALVFVAGVFFIGAGYSVCESVSAALISDLYPDSSTRYINICQCALSVGAVLSPVTIHLIIQQFDMTWRVLFVICAAAYFILLFPLIKFKFSGMNTKQVPTSNTDFRNYFRSTVFITLFAAIILYVGLENGFGYFAKTLFDLKLDASDYGSWAISAYWMGMAISRMAAGLRKQSPKKVLIVSFALSGVIFTILALSQSALISLAACALTGMAFGPIWSTLVDLAAKAFPDSSGGAIGLMSSGCGVGGVLYPILMGIMADFFDIGIAFLLLAATALAGGILCVSLSKHR